MNLFNQYGVIDLAAIDPAEVALLDDNQQKLLASLMTAVEAREAAALRVTNAVRAVGTATQEQIDAMAAHVAVNPPPTFADIHAASVAAYKPN